jgi:hypothetical protein
MTLQRASCQSPGLEEFYRELSASSDNTTAEIGRMMLRLLPEIPPAFRGKRLWGLTSLYRLCLLAADDYRTPWYVRIIGDSGGQYEIHYRMSEVDQPWPDAFRRRLGDGIAPRRRNDRHRHGPFRGLVLKRLSNRALQSDDRVGRFAPFLARR